MVSAQHLCGMNSVPIWNSVSPPRFAAQSQETTANTKIGEIFYNIYKNKSSVLSNHFSSSRVH